MTQSTATVTLLEQLIDTTTARGLTDDEITQLYAAVREAPFWDLADAHAYAVRCGVGSRTIGYIIARGMGQRRPRKGGLR